tara:strand:+ start:272 stop:409 length:138 start_codon:yes stop_codon:yes gene_type:complete
VPTALRLADYDREDEGAWLLLESAPVAEEAAEPQRRRRQSPSGFT